MQEDSDRILTLESIVRSLSESNRLLAYQIQQQDSKMIEITKVLNEVRDAVMRLEAIEAARDYPAQLGKVKEDMNDLDDRIRQLENTNTKNDAQKSVVGWVIENWLGISSLGIAIFLVFKYAVH